MGYRWLSRPRERLRLVVPWLRAWNTPLRSSQPYARGKVRVGRRRGRSGAGVPIGSQYWCGEDGCVKVRVWVHKSRIAGLGLFAAQDIRQGTQILPYIGEKITKAESTRRLAQGNVYIFTFNERYDIVGALLRNTARYSNHSCDPNCAIEKTTRTLWLVALRDISDGEELTYNYGYA